MFSNILSPTPDHIFALTPKARKQQNCRASIHEKFGDFYKRQSLNKEMMLTHHLNLRVVSIHFSCYSSWLSRRFLRIIDIQVLVNCSAFFFGSTFTVSIYHQVPAFVVM